MQKKYNLTRFSSNEVDINQIKESNFTIKYKEELNPSQYEAATALEGAYLIIAGAGTGKTRTLVYRVAHLVESGNDPRSILLLTFTRKAAKEMLDRSSILLDKRCEKINGGTFHSFANITLRKYAKAIGLEPSFTILDQTDSEDVINLLRNQSGTVTKEKRFPNKQTLFKIFSLSVNTEVPIEKLVYTEYPHFLDDLDEIVKLQKMYFNFKKRSNLLDYDDLLIYLRDFLLELSPAAKSLLNQLNFVMVDEYQDTNKIQADIVVGLTQLKQNIMVVGDDSQSIYSFRGANFKNIMDFPKLFNNVKIIKLEENYRSTQEVLNFANRIVDAAIEKYPKFLFTNKKGGNLPVIIASENTNLQSKFIVEKILDLREEGIPLRDIAVLFRSSFFSFDLEIELAKANIPFKKFGGMKFVETAHIKDVLAFLRVSFNPKDFVSWNRILLLHDGVGPRSAQKIIDLLANGKLNIDMNPDSHSEKIITEKLYNLFLLIYELRTKNLSPSEQTMMVIDYYIPIFKEKYDDFHKRRKDLDIFLNITENYKSLESLLSDILIDPPIDSTVDIEAEDKENEFLTLSTIHSAKGLEWNTVFLIHAIDGFFPSTKSAEKTEDLEEERRLFYVAVTRAKQNLYITYPMNIYDRESGTTFSKPSRFIADITSDLAEGYLLENDY
ncbi:MAG: ATP-dependent helicase [Ignavibacterium sp.]